MSSDCIAAGAQIGRLRPDVNVRIVAVVRVAGTSDEQWPMQQRRAVSYRRRLRRHCRWTKTSASLLNDAQLPRSPAIAT